MSMLANLDYVTLLSLYVTKPSDIETVVDRVSKGTGDTLTYTPPLGSLALTKQQAEYLAS